MDLISRAISRAGKFRHSVGRLNAPRQNEYGVHFNTPLRFTGGDWFVNERIVEIAFVNKHLALDGSGKRALEFGCARSYLALQLASLGYEVVGVDLREYRFTHPRLSTHRQNLVDLEDDQGFDLITAISVIEHVGLAAYGENRSEATLRQVAVKLLDLLRPGGRLIATVPLGKAHEDRFLRSFSHSEILSLFKSEDLCLIDERFFRRSEFKFWQPCDIRETTNVSNSSSDRGPTGVNCVGCFAWRRRPF